MNSKGFYAMGGNFNAVGNASISGEFNFLADPEAAYVVLNKTPSPVVLVPWEICGFDIKMPMVIYKLHIKHNLSQLFLK